MGQHLIHQVEAEAVDSCLKSLRVMLSVVIKTS